LGRSKVEAGGVGDRLAFIGEDDMITGDVALEDGVDKAFIGNRAGLA
jgi:hypothetical protein